jgi:hypothetical protein
MFGLLEAAQTAIRTDHPFSDPMSVYAAGRYGFLQTSAFVSLAVGSGTLSVGLGYLREPPRGWRLARIILALCSLGVCLAAAFPIDLGDSTSTAGAIHHAASALTFITILVAMFLLSTASRSVPHWTSFSRHSTGLARAATACSLVAAVAQHSVTFGIAHRLFLGAVVVWLVVAGALLQMAAAASPV